ncbi:SDR family NAD(P)-dependent oxidoreductase [Microbacterium xanthum]|uniref:SDR family NAD(P)-dependent oxidoreductase n=1 Tax=Microbacterium xanthum TaxID=3079794 RepID=UPI002AD22D49|nr:MULTISPECIES: SDR family NAD(P)-dependent oxidoreductase [unclassified Microbacterium]MDZ8171621.1 SDR family NAD(P)-dependent oxidoreductase [Microbacterium sp. KSW-48]MDZ8200293.1 SDR family NAD(P)-dependent oxidoreductase [Microbacterium sp. SSW1-59]
MSDDVTTRGDRVPGVAARTVLLAGGTSEAGRVAARVLTAAGAHVIVAARDHVALDTLRETLPGVRTEQCDLTDEEAVAGLARQVGALDGVLHLVGGWRGGGGLAGQTDADFRVLEASLTALRHVSRAFDPALRASDAARTAIVSSTAVTRPLAGGANYAAVKAAAEAWNRAVAHGFAKAARDADEPLRAAAVTYRVKALAGLEFALADAFARLWDDDAAAVNDTVVTLG